MAGSPEVAAATELLTSVVVERQVEEWLDWVHRRTQEPEEWQRAAEHGDALLYLTPDELDRVQRPHLGARDGVRRAAR